MIKSNTQQPKIIGFAAEMLEGGLEPLKPIETLEVVALRAEALAFIRYRCKLETGIKCTEPKIDLKKFALIDLLDAAAWGRSTDKLLIHATDSKIAAWFLVINTDLRGDNIEDPKILSGFNDVFIGAFSFNDSAGV